MTFSLSAVRVDFSTNRAASVALALSSSPDSPCSTPTAKHPACKQEKIQSVSVGPGRNPLIGQGQDTYEVGDAV